MGRTGSEQEEVRGATFRKKNGIKGVIDRSGNAHADKN
jgi:hypothetical protein